MLLLETLVTEDYSVQSHQPRSHGRQYHPSTGYLTNTVRISNRPTWLSNYQDGVSRHWPGSYLPVHRKSCDEHVRGARHPYSGWRAVRAAYGCTQAHGCDTYQPCWVTTVVSPSQCTPPWPWTVHTPHSATRKMHLLAQEQIVPQHLYPGPSLSGLQAALLTVYLQYFLPFFVFKRLPQTPCWCKAHCYNYSSATAENW